MNNHQNYEELLNLANVIADVLNVTEEVNDKLKELVAKLIDLNIKQLENKISKEEAKTLLKKLIDEHFELEEISADVKKYKIEKVSPKAKQKQ